MREEILRYLLAMKGEKSAGTLAKYRHDLLAFAAFSGGEVPTLEMVARWRESLLAAGYAPCTINSMLAALNGFFRFSGLPIHAKYLKIQRKIFREERREMSRAEYERLLKTAKNRGEARLALLMETLCATGIRIGELRHITVEGAKMGRADIALKGKIRTILLPKKLCRKLLQYAKKMQITAGEIFRTKSGRGISRRQAWHEMKRLCKAAGVAESKVFPHNLRHLFATTFYRAYRDIARLADLLGHSSIETTRIYLATSGKEQQRQLEKMGLIL